MLSHLFSKCPVLPVDPSVSIAKYSSIIGNTLSDAVAFERQGDAESLERAALLHIRILQLICKTLPSHPEYTIPENEAVIRHLSKRADTCFARLEAYAASLAKARSASEPVAHDLRPPEEVIPSGGGSRTAPDDQSAHNRKASDAILSRGLRKIIISTQFVALLERIAAENMSRGVETVGAIAGRIVADDSNDDSGRESLHATALVIPAQEASVGGSEAQVQYLSDLASLVSAKQLVHFGWLRVIPPSIDYDGRLLGRDGAQLHAHCHSAFPEAVTGIILSSASEHHERVGWFSLLRAARAHVAGEGQAADAKGDAESRTLKSHKSPPAPPGMVVAEHLVARSDAEAPSFKLYDLRPMADVHKARAAANAGPKEGTT